MTPPYLLTTRNRRDVTAAGARRRHDAITYMVSSQGSCSHLFSSMR